MFYTILVIVCNLIFMIKANGYQKLNFSPDYNLHELPPSDGPLLIEASINLSNILEVLEKQQLISLETSLRLYWKDSRIRPVERFLEGNDSLGPYTTLNPKLAENIWMPDIFIDKAKSVRKPVFFIPPAYLRLYNDSLVKYSARMNYDVACPMDFKRFPVDEQTCQINFESFGHSSSQFVLRWKNISETNINKNINLAQFKFSVQLSDSYSTENYDVAYPGLSIQIHLEREVGYHVLQTFLPSAMFVVLAWLSLFIEPESIPGRVAMGMTTLLTLTAMFSSVRQNVPKVSYVSLLDIWMVGCIFFVFASIGEFIMVTAMIRNGQKKESLKVEDMFKIAIPFIFVIFNFAYWPVLLC